MERNKDILAKIERLVLRCERIEDSKWIAKEIYDDAEKCKQRARKEIMLEVMNIVGEHYEPPQVNTAISSPFMRGEQAMVRIIYEQLKQLAEKKGIDLGGSDG